MESTENTATALPPWNKGKLVGQKTPLQAERDLGHSRPSAARWSAPRTCPVQLGHRQQTPRLRPRQAEGAGSLPRPDRGLADNCAAAEASKAGSVRNYRADTGGRGGLDRSCETALGERPLSKPTSWLKAPVHPAVRPIVDSWVRQLGLDAASYGTHTLRRTKATLIYRRTKNLRAVQLLLGHALGVPT